MLYRFIPHIHQVPSVQGSWKREWSISKFSSFPGLWRWTKFCCAGLVGQDQCQSAAFRQALFSSWCLGGVSFASPVFWTARLPSLSRGLGGNSSTIWQCGLITKLLQGSLWGSSSRSGYGSQTTSQSLNTGYFRKSLLFPFQKDLNCSGKCPAVRPAGVGSEWLPHLGVGHLVQRFFPSVLLPK